MIKIIFAVLILTILGVGIFFGIKLISEQTQLKSQAAHSTAPEKVRITNLSDNSFTVSWLTSEQAISGFVTFGQDDKLGQSASDDRDSGAPQNRFTHYVTLKNLEPNKIYFFKINSGKDLYDDNGKAFSQKTAPTTEDTPSLEKPIFGKVVKADSSTPKEVIIYGLVGDNTPISTYPNDKGNWTLNLNNSRIKSLDKYLKINPTDTINILVLAGADGQAQASGSVQNPSSFQKIILTASASQTQQAVEDDGFGLIKANFGKKGTNIPGDLNHDGVINTVDFAIFLRGKK